MRTFLDTDDGQSRVLVDDDGLLSPPVAQLRRAHCRRPRDGANALLCSSSSSGAFYELQDRLCPPTARSQWFRARVWRERETETERDPERDSQRDAQREGDELCDAEPTEEWVAVEVVSPAHRVRVEREIGTLQALSAHANLLPLIEAFELLQEEKDNGDGNGDTNSPCSSLSGKLCLFVRNSLTFCLPHTAGDDTSANNACGLLFLVFPAHDRFTLSEYFDEQGESLPRPLVQSILTQLAGVLLHCQRHGVAHGDVCPQNILVDVREDGWPHVYLIDFGAALHLRRHGETVTLCGRVFNENSDNICFHCPYYSFLPQRPSSMSINALSSAPESFTEDRDNVKSYFHPMMADVWSLGLVFFALLTSGRHSLFSQPMMVDNVFAFIKTDSLSFVLDEWWQLGLDRDAQELLVAMLQCDPLRRPFLEKIFAHRFFSVVVSSSTYLGAQISCVQAV